MSHVDEGTLHAYLDTLERGDAAGALDAASRADVEAHLAGCASCATMLAEARTLRGRAGTILGAATPAIDVPPFESMVARAPARRPARRWVPMAWAASLVLAVGSGWIASGLWREGRIEGPFRASQESVAERGAPSTDESPARAPEPAAGSTAPVAGNAADATDPAAPRPEPRVQAGEPTVATSPSREPTEVQAEALVVPSSVGAAAAPLRLAEDAQAKARTEARAQRGATDFAPAAAAPPPAAVPQRLEAAASTLEAVIAGGYPGDTVAAWSGSTPAAAADLLGGPLELLAEARVLSVEIAAPALVRVRQQLPGGLEAELVQWRNAGGGADLAVADADASAAAADREEADALRVLREGRTTDGRAWVLVARGDRRLAVRAPAGVAPLALLARLERPARP